MRKLTYILILALMGCASQQNVIHEDALYVTRKYVGEYEVSLPGKNSTRIVTTQNTFSITGNPQLNLSEGDRCYVKYIAERLAGTHSNVWVLYFTWDGTEDLYMLRQDWVTGQIY